MNPITDIVIMPLSINNVTLAGNLTRDPDMKVVNQQTVVQFSLAINRKWKNADGVAQGDVTYVDIEAWGKTAEVVGKFLVKGSPCYLEGRLKLDLWQDHDGKDRQRLKVVARRVQLMLARTRDAQDPIVSEDVDHADPDTAHTAAHDQSSDTGAVRIPASQSTALARITAKPATKLRTGIRRANLSVAVLDQDRQPAL